MFDTDKSRLSLFYYKGFSHRIDDLIDVVRNIDKDLYDRLVSARMDQDNAFDDLISSIKEEKEES